MLLLDKIEERKLNFFFRYCFIGFLSISLELLIRKILLNFNFDNNLSIFLALLIGISFAFFFNIKFNFNIPRYYYKKSFIYFSIISISSFTFQFLLAKIFFLENFNYEISRFFISGAVFLIAYNFHIKFSFAKNKKVGIAVYLDNKENIQNIFSKVGYYPDYIHVDFVDETMNKNISKPDFERLSEIRKWWPNHKIESHIMSTRPLKYVDKLSEYSDVIYFHLEIEDNLNEVKELINSYKIKPGLVLHTTFKYENIENLIGNYKEILVLCIEKPGESGQEFLNKSNHLIDEINQLKIRGKFNLCVDGGLSKKNINKIECDKIVSASNVFKNENPKKQIINLQKLLNK